MPKPKGSWSDSLFPAKRPKIRAKILGLSKECPYCGEEMIHGHGALKPTRDHVMPKSKGYDLNGNKIVCCSECNGLKSNRTLVEWLIALAKKTDAKNMERARRINLLIRQRHRAGRPIDLQPIDGSIKSA